MPEDTPTSLNSKSSTPSDLNSNVSNARPATSVHPIPVRVTATKTKVGLREFYAEKIPVNHYEKTAVFVYYLVKFNNQQEVRYGEILSCYEEVDEKKPAIIEIVKNSIRYKGWLEQGSEKYTTRLTIAGENFVKFDLPGRDDDSSQLAQKVEQELLDNLDKSPKQKLTLGLDGAVIERARAAGINISAITENVLKAMTYDAKGATKEDIISAYQRLFKIASHILNKYGTSVEVGIENVYEFDGNDPYVSEERRIELDDRGILWKYVDADSATKVDVASQVEVLYLPVKFLEKLITALTEAAYKNKEKLKELEIAMRFVKTLSGEENSK